MPKLTCPCGFVHDLSPIPDDGWLTIRDKDFSELYPSESSSAEERLSAWWELQQRAGGMYICPKCGRLMWSPPGKDCYYQFQIFTREEATAPNSVDPTPIDPQPLAALRRKEAP